MSRPPELKREPTRSGYILPPTILLVNTKSGGKKGIKIIKRYKDKYKVFNLLELNKNEKIFNEFVNELKCIYEKITKTESIYIESNKPDNEFIPECHPRIIICGGDGTIGWGLSTLDKAILKSDVMELFLERKSANIKAQKIINNIFKFNQKSNNNNSNIEMLENKSNMDKEFMNISEWKGIELNESIKELLNKISIETQELQLLRAIYSTKIAPCLGVIPLGSGNDLSRCLGSGNTYPGTNTVNKLIEYYTTAPTTSFDRWAVQFFDQKKIKKLNKPTQMLNYFSIGYTAQITFEVEERRRIYPSKMNKPWKNFIHYGRIGAKNCCTELCKNYDLNSYVELYINDKKMELPPKTKSLVISNISSMANGINFWGDPKNNSKKIYSENNNNNNNISIDEDEKIARITQFERASLGDGLLEVMCSKGITKFIQLSLGVSHYNRLAQANKVTLILKKEFPIQIDGEAWIEKSGIIDFSLLNKMFALIGKTGKERGVISV